MIKLRNRDGSRFKVGSDVAFIEICDGTGALGALVHVLDDGRISVATEGDALFAKYARAYGSRVCGVQKQATPEEVERLWKKREVDITKGTGTSSLPETPTR